MPQAFGSSGGQVGTGSMLAFATVTLFFVEAELVCVEATAPVTTRATTKARTRCFMMGYP